jgi:beta-N-acetylhexosaminidase
MSRVVLHDLLRGALGFSGVVVSDALDMAGASRSLGMAGAAVGALRAGCDLLCLGTENTDGQLTEIERAVKSAVVESAVSSERVSEAGDRVRSLAEDLITARRTAGPPPSSAPSWPGDEAALFRAFNVQPGASNWRARASGGYTVVRLEANPNIAVGITPWGPFASEGFTRQPMYVVTSERSGLPAFQPDQPVLVVGRDIHRHPFARQTTDWLRFQHVDVLVVDMGWPSEDRQYADVATFGASRLMGRALLEWLTATA